jgi:hypothetical protein
VWSSCKALHTATQERTEATGSPDTRPVSADGICSRRSDNTERLWPSAPKAGSQASFHLKQRKRNEKRVPTDLEAEPVGVYIVKATIAP